MNNHEKDPVISLDLMGGDSGPAVTVPAAKRALLISKNLNLILVGREQECLPMLTKHGLLDNSRVKFIATPNVISSEEVPSHALKHSQDTSMRKAIELVADGSAHACVSAGNTGALMAVSRYILHTVPGIDRPALAAFVPNEKKQRTLLLDLGANVECDAKNLVQFALLGCSEFSRISNTERPKVALLNIGVEHNKGREYIKKADAILTGLKEVDYIGYIESDSLFNSDADVIVCDGFTGNIALKSSEGLVRLIVKTAKQRYRGFFSLPVLLILKGVMSKLYPDEYNGASLLGLQGVVIKSHGSAKIKATANAIIRAQYEARIGLSDRFLELLGKNLF